MGNNYIEGIDDYKMFKDLIMQLETDSSDIHTFENLLSIGEMCIKTACNIFCTLLRTIDEDKANLFIKGAVVDGDGVGSWLEATRRAVDEIMRSSKPELLEFTEFWTRKASSIYNITSIEVKRFTGDLSPETFSPSKKVSGILDLIVFTRNKKSHGAYKENFYKKHNEIFRDIIINFLRAFLSFLKTKNIVIFSISHSKSELKIEIAGERGQNSREIDGLIAGDGIYIEFGKFDFLRGYDSMSYVDGLYYYMNSKIDGKGEAEYLSYSDGSKLKKAVNKFNTQVKKLRSHTSSKAELVEGEVVWHNLPKIITEYIERRELEDKLLEILCDRKRRIITLYGRGGAGKTTIALEAAHRLAAGDTDEHRFSHIIWASARNVDLLDSGPKEVARDISSIDSIANFVKNTLNDKSQKKSTEYLNSILGTEGKDGILLIVDNFETAENPKYIHDVLEDIVVLPNKVLFTSRTRKLEKDYPLEVHAMDVEEAEKLALATAREFNTKIDTASLQFIINKSGRIPYIIKLMVSNYSKNSSSLSAAISMTMNDESVRNALFKTSYKLLNEKEKMLFTCLSKIENEIVVECGAGFLAIWSENEFNKEDIYKVIDDMKSVSIITEKTYNDSTWLSIPVDARSFAVAELEKESFQVEVKPSVNQYIKLLSTFTNIDRGEDLETAILMSYMSCDRFNSSWLDQFVSGMCIYNRSLVRARAFGMLDKLDCFTKDEVQNAFEKAVGYYSNDSELRYKYARFLRYNTNNYESAAVNAIEASDNDNENAEYAFFAAQTVNEYFRRRKKDTAPVTMNLRRQLIDNIARRLQIMTTNMKNKDSKLYTQLFWLYINGGQMKSADQVRQHAAKLFPNDAYVREAMAMDLRY